MEAAWGEVGWLRRGGVGAAWGEVVRRCIRAAYQCQVREAGVLQRTTTSERVLSCAPNGSATLM